MPEQGGEAGGGEPGGTGTDHGDTLARGGQGNEAGFMPGVGGKPLQRMDGDGLVVFGPVAFGFARMRACLLYTSTSIFCVPLEYGPGSSRFWLDKPVQPIPRRGHSIALLVRMELAFTGATRWHRLNAGQLRLCLVVSKWCRMVRKMNGKLIIFKVLFG